MNKLWNIFIILLCIIFIGVSVGSAFRESLTFDEIVHIQEGLNAWKHQTFAIDTNNPPFIREVQTIPILFHSQDWLSSHIPNIQMLPSRMITIFIGIILLLEIVFFVKKYFGVLPSVFAGILFSFEPTILANSHYVTQDIGVTFLFFISYISFLSLKKDFSYKKLFFFSLFFGLGCVSKVSFIPYFLLSIVCIVLYERKNIFTLLWIYKKRICTACFIAMLTIWATYFFKTNVVIVERADNTRISEKVLSYAKKHNDYALKSTIMFLKMQKIPLGDYMAVIKNNALRSKDNHTCFFLGAFSQCNWYMVFVNFFLKIPISLLILFGISIMVTWKKKKNRTVFMYMLFPILSIFLVASISRIDPRIRYILPLYPFIIIISALSLTFWLKTYKRLLIFLILIVWFVGGSVASFPHFISYTNELAGNNKYFLLDDSNMDWGQSLPDVAIFHQKSNHAISLSYFGRDNGDLYGLVSKTKYGSYKTNEICAFHTISGNKKTIPIISISNWYVCGYNKTTQYRKANIKGIVGESFFVF